MTDAATYGARPIRHRRTAGDMHRLKEDLRRIVEKGKPMTVRQVFYQAVTEGIVEKTEAEYKGTVGRLLTEMRLDGLSYPGSPSSVIPFEWIADSTRWMRKSPSYSSLDEMLREAARFYRRDLWDSQDAYVEVWLEKDALAGVVFGVTDEWDVPLMVTRGYPSISFLHAAAVAMPKDTSCFLYYLGDHDPSGVDIPRNVEARLREFAPDVDLTFERIAVTPEQIAEMNLPTRPTKRSDSRSKGFVGESVEVDAIAPAVLREMVEDRILEHVDLDAYAVLKAAERSEREIMQRIAAGAS
jgi:hypothetical protein